jgi:integrase
MSVAIARRNDRRDPRLALPDLVDVAVARALWESLPVECRSDHFDKSNLPARYDAAVVVESAGGSWTSRALNMRGLPEVMTWELAWLIHREMELGRVIRPVPFNAATRVLRAATTAGGATATTARSLLDLTARDWVRQGHRARLAGMALGPSNDGHALHAIKRWQDVLVYAYPHGEWWRLNVWNPVLDDRIPQRPHEPAGRHVANFSHLGDEWLREGAKWWLAACLEAETYSWSSVKSRLDGLKWLQRHIERRPVPGPQLVDSIADLRSFIRSFVASMKAHRSTSGPTRGQPLGGMVRRQTMVTIEQFYRFMYDHRAEAAEVLHEPRWAELGTEHTVLFRPEDKPRFTNRHDPDMVLEDDVMTAIANGAELLALPADQGGIGDIQAFHALLLLLRTGRRLNEILLMDFEPLLPLVGTTHPVDAETTPDTIVARLRYQETKIGSPSATIPVDAEVVSIVRAQQRFAREFMHRAGHPDTEPVYLFLRPRVNRFGRIAYASATLHLRLKALGDRLQLTDSQGRHVRISRTHQFRHTRATTLLNAGVPLHVVMRYLGHVTPAMTMHYAQTLSETAEREFLRFKKITADGRQLAIDPSDLYDALHLDQRADRILPNGWCMLPPKQRCARGNACLGCGEFVTDARHRAEHAHQLEATVQLIDVRQATFRQRYGTDMPPDNIWLSERHTELDALRRIIAAIDTSGHHGVRGAGSSQSEDATRRTGSDQQ